jgi:hypothetical protein
LNNALACVTLQQGLVPGSLHTFCVLLSATPNPRILPLVNLLLSFDGVRLIHRNNVHGVKLVMFLILHQGLVYVQGLMAFFGQQMYTIGQQYVLVYLYSIDVLLSCFRICTYRFRLHFALCCPMSTCESSWQSLLILQTTNQGVHLSAQSVQASAFFG